MTAKEQTTKEEKTEKNTLTEVTLDATNKKLGRVASEAAVILMGKTTPGYRPHETPRVKVSITNASKALIDNKKLSEKIYKRYSGYPGGLKEIPMRDIVERKGYAEVFRIAVLGMLPKNKLARTTIKKLTVTE